MMMKMMMVKKELDVLASFFKFNIITIFVNIYALYDYQFLIYEIFLLANCYYSC